MSDKNGGHDWAKDWEALQRQYWTAWTDLTRSQPGATPDPSTPWHEGLEQWSRMFSAAGKQSEAAERLMSSAKSYLDLMQSMLSFAAGRDASAINVPSWLDAMRNGMNLPGFDASAFKLPGFDASAFKVPGFDASAFKLPGFDPSAFKMPGFDPAAFKLPGFDPSAFGNMPGFDAAALINNPVAKAMREISGQGVKGIEQLASGALPMLQQFRQEGLSWLRAPAFGYAREHQEHYQKMALAFADFQEALKQYNALILKSSQRSFEILELKIAERSEPGRQIDSMRALYDLWVDAAEEAYAEIALSEEFRSVYGELVNTQMRVRSQLQQEVERIGVDLGMPTRSELNSVHKRLHDLRRELRESQEAQRSPAGDGRDQEIAAMRAEIDELRRLLENSAAPAPRSAPAKRDAAAPNAGTRSKRPRSKAKRVAAKRSHVATKTAAVAPPPKPVPAATVETPKPAHGNARRAPRRAPAAKRVVSGPAKTRDSKPSAPVSFGDAIAAMRRELGKGRKSSAARTATPTRISPAIRRKN
jgi:hypothetical protein